MNNRFPGLNRSNPQQPPELGEPIIVDVPGTATPTTRSTQPAQPRQRINPRYITIGVILVVLCLLCAGGFFAVQAFFGNNIQASIQSTQEVQSPIAGQPTQSQQSAPGLPTFTPMSPAGGPVINPTTSAGNLPVNGGVTEIRAGFPSYGTYFNTIIVKQMNLQGRPYKLVLVPLRFSTPDGLELNPGSEADQVKLLRDNNLDILLNTPDILVKNPSTGAVSVMPADQSKGGDKFIRWMIGKTKECAGRQINKVNDLNGCHIAVMRDSVGEFMVLSFLRIAELTPNDVIIDRYDTVDDAVAAFNEGKADAVAGWTPTIDKAIEAGGRELLNSKQLGTTTDIIIVSVNAKANKSDAIFAFLVDWFWAMKLQAENPEQAYEMIASWEYVHTFPDGHTETFSTNDWTYVYPGSAYNDMKLWMEDQVAQADLAGVFSILDNETVQYTQMINVREAWAWGGANIDEQSAANELVDTSFLHRLDAYAKEHPEIFPVEDTELINPTYNPFTKGGEQRTAEELAGMPTVAELGFSKFEWKPGQTNFDLTKADEKAQYETLLRYAKSLAALSETGSVEFFVTVSSARPTWYTDARSMAFSNARGETIRKVLEAAGVQSFRIIINPIIGKPTELESEMEKDRWFKIEIKIPQG